MGWSVNSMVDVQVIAKQGVDRVSALVSSIM